VIGRDFAGEIVEGQQDLMGSAAIELIHTRADR